MKHIFPIMLLLFGCAQGRMAVVREGADIRFSFGSGKEPVGVLGIAVFEMDDGNRGQTICNVGTSSKFAAPVEMSTWIYGRPIAQASFYPVGCGPLVIGREYGITITDGSHRNLFKRFRLAEDGRILTVD